LALQGTSSGDFGFQLLELRSIRIVHPIEERAHACTQMLDADFMQNVAAPWAVAHGVADLLVAGRMESISTLPAKARQSAITAVLRRVIT